MTLPEKLAREAAAEISRWVPFDDADNYQQQLAIRDIEAAIRKAINLCAFEAEAVLLYSADDIPRRIRALLTDEAAP